MGGEVVYLAVTYFLLQINKQKMLYGHLLASVFLHRFDCKRDMQHIIEWGFDVGTIYMITSECKFFLFEKIF